MAGNLKIDLARAQLGTATDLFIRDRDPVSVQALACGACELLEGAGQQSGVKVLSTYLTETQPGLDIAKLKHIRNKHWNAMKHFYHSGGVKVRDDEELMGSFSDELNDGYLFEGWYDYLLVTKMLPVEAQVFQAWFFAIEDHRLDPGVDRTPYLKIFPGIGSCDRSEQKRRLRRVIEKYRKHAAILEDPRTERRPLVNRRPT